MQGEQLFAQRFQHVGGGLALSRWFARGQLLELIFHRRVVQFRGHLAVINASTHAILSFNFVYLFLVSFRFPPDGQAISVWFPSDLVPSN